MISGQFCGNHASHAKRRREIFRSPKEYWGLVGNSPDALDDVRALFLDSKAIDCPICVFP